MALSIQQNPIQIKNSFSLQRRAELTGVRLVAASIKSTDPEQSESAVGPVAIEVGFSNVSSKCSGGSMRVLLAFGAKAHDSSPTPTEIFSVKCRFEMTYELEEGYQPTQDEMDAFAGGNAVFNAWSFFREFAQNTVVRMGFPSTPTIPFLRLAPPVEAKTPKTESNTGERETKK